MSADRSDKPAAGPDGANGLLGDLESIRTLLSEEEASARNAPEATEAEPASPEPAGESERDLAASQEAAAPADSSAESARPEHEVPLLDDVVEGALGVNELTLDLGPDMDHRAGGPRLDDDLFRVLLGDDWRDAAAGILDQARSVIESHQQQWLPEDTDALNAALRVRIDETLHRWLRQAILDGMDDLKARLLQAITDELEVSVRQHLTPEDKQEDPNGE